MLLFNMNAKQSGFTLIELLFAVAVLAVLVGIGLPNMQEFVRNSRIASDPTT